MKEIKTLVVKEGEFERGNLAEASGFTLPVRREELYASLEMYEELREEGEFLEAQQCLEHLIDTIGPLPPELSVDNHYRVLLNSEAHFQLADLYEGPLYKPQVALDHFWRAIIATKFLLPLLGKTAHKRIANMCYRRALIHEDTEDNLAALRDWTRGINSSLEADEPKLYERGILQRARLYTLTGHDYEAIDDFGTIRETNSKQLGCYKIGIALYDIEPRLALSQFSRALMHYRIKEPDNMSERVRCYVKQRELEQSLLSGYNN